MKRWFYPVFPCLDVYNLLIRFKISIASDGTSAGFINMLIFGVTGV